MLSPTSGAFELNPSDDVLSKAARFRATGAIQDLSGRLKNGHLRPPYKAILMTYYRALWEERQKPRRGCSEESANVRAVRSTANKFGSTPETCKKHLEKARKRCPDLVNPWKGKGAQWIEAINELGWRPPRSDAQAASRRNGPTRVM